MHILELPSFFTPYGGEFCLEQAKALRSLGHEVRILSNVQLGLSISKLRYFTYPYGRSWSEDDGVPVYQTLMRGYPKQVRRNMERWVAVVRSMFADYVRQHGKPDVVHAHCAKWAGYVAMLIADDYGVPYVITEHMSLHTFQSEFGTAPSSSWQIPLLRKAYERAKMVIPVAEELVDDISCYFGKNYRWQAISNMIDVDFFAFRSRSSLSGRPFRFVCSAISEWRKGYDVLLAAFDQMEEKNAELHICGRGTDLPAFGRSVNGLASASRIFVHGDLNKQQVRDLLWQCDALALATRGEVQPLVLLEAMSTGIPYVSTEKVPRCERLEGAAHIVPVDDVAAFAKAMDALVRKGFAGGERVSEQVRQMASPAVVARQIEEVLKSVVG